MGKSKDAPPESPAAPPPLAAMEARKQRLEKERALLFVRWKDALSAAQGNVTRAAADFASAPGEPKMDRNRGNKLTRRFRLTKWAAQLREAATGHARGRQDR